jgi:hypothetical protein
MQVNVQHVELFTYLFSAITCIIVMIEFIRRFRLKKRLIETYPDLTQSQRLFMYKTVEPTDQCILKCLQEKLTNKGVKREFRQVQRSEQHVTVQAIYNCDDNIGTRVVVFDSDKKNTFTYDKINHSTVMMSPNDLLSILV